MQPKKQESIITSDDIDLLNSIYSSVRPITKKPLESQHYKPQEKIIDTNTFDPISSISIHRSEQRNINSRKLKPSITLDLHGMTLNNAFKTLEHTIHYAYENQNRLLLVITGKGNNSITGSGVLKQELPRWLALSSIASKIVNFSIASPKDGGDGAFYIFIKRIKS